MRIFVSRDKTILNKKAKFMSEKKTWIKPQIEYERVGGMQQLILELSSGKRVPKTDKEKRLYRQIKDLEKQGKTIDLPLE